MVDLPRGLQALGNGEWQALMEATRKLRRIMRCARLGPATPTNGSSLANNAPPWHDAAHMRHESLGTGALRRRRPLVISNVSRSSWVGSHPTSFSLPPTSR